MPKKIQKRDTEVRENFGRVKGTFPNYDIPEPKYMNVKPYRSRDMKKTYGKKGGDMQVVIKKANPKPVGMTLIEREALVHKMLKNPRKYAKLS